MVPRARPAGGGGAQQHRLQPHPQRRPGDRRRRSSPPPARPRPSRSTPSSYVALIVRAAALAAAAPAERLLPREALRRGDGRGPALRRDVAGHRQGAAARLLLRLRPRSRCWRCCRWSRGDLVRRRAAGLRPACSAPSASAPSAARSSATGCARGCRARRSSASPSPASPSARSIAGTEPVAWLTGARPAHRRRLLGAGAGALQHDGAARRRRAGWSAARSRSTRPRPSAAWRSAAGSGASPPTRCGLAAGPARRGRRHAVAGVLIGFRLPLPPRTSRNLDPLDRWPEPAVELEVLPSERPDPDRDHLYHRAPERAGIPRRDGRPQARPPA